MTHIRDRILQPDQPEDFGRWSAALDRARIPILFRDAKLELVKDEKVRDTLSWMINTPAEWVENPRSPFICGPFNTGKSAAAAILAMDMVARCASVMWIATRDIPGVRFEKTPAAAALNARLETLDLLVMDDLGAQGFKLSGAGGTAIEDVARIMYERKRPVVYTSNSVWAQVSTQYAELRGFVSLLERTCVPVVMTKTWGRS